jgi:DNA (cytosine-5)-methyltransferase 1
VEIEAFAIANLVAKMENEQIPAAPIYTNVKTFPYERFSGCVDILSGGFPCQPFSAAGARKGVEDPRHIYPYISRGISKCKPRIVFLENVEGIISSKTADEESVLKYVLGDLESMGYRATAGIFSASEVGAPHQRKRVFIMGYSCDKRCKQNATLRNKQQSSRIDEVSRESRGKLGYSESECNGLNEAERQRGDTAGSTGEELVNTDSNGHGKHTTTSKAEPIGGTEATIMPRSNEVANTISKRPGGRQSSRPSGMDQTGSEAEKEREASYDIRSEVEGCGGKLPNTDSQGLEGLRECNNSKGWQTPDGQPRSYCEVWPARPNEPQYEWEEPRTKPKLGRTANGTTSRVDRLRLLGNGVVPLTAARAFKVLIGRVID